jgi:hypothetical protein
MRLGSSLLTGVTHRNLSYIPLTHKSALPQHRSVDKRSADQNRNLDRNLDRSIKQAAGALLACVTSDSSIHKDAPSHYLFTMFKLRRSETPWEVVENKSVEPVPLYYDDDGSWFVPWLHVAV